MCTNKNTNTLLCVQDYMFTVVLQTLTWQQAPQPEPFFHSQDTPATLPSFTVFPYSPKPQAPPKTCIINQWDKYVWISFSYIIINSKIAAQKHPKSTLIMPCANVVECLGLPIMYTAHFFETHSHAHFLISPLLKIVLIVFKNISVCESVTS